MNSTTKTPLVKPTPLPLFGQDTIIAAVIDASGSMSVNVKEVCDGFNSFIAKQLEVPGTAKLFLTFFNSAIYNAVENLPLDKFNKLDSTNYVPDGTTALLDAVGHTIKSIDAVRHGRKVLFCIITDGLENCSRTFNKAQIKELIQERGGHGWEFIYICSDLNSFAEAVNSYGIKMDNAAMFDRHDPTAYAKAFAGTSVATANLRNMGEVGNWKGDLDTPQTELKTS